MEINLFKNISNALNKVDVNNFIKQLTERMNNMNRELVIDRIEDNIAVCQDRKTKEMLNIKMKELPVGCTEGTVLKYENNKYVIDKEFEKIVSNRIKNKMDDLWE